MILTQVFSLYDRDSDGPGTQLPLRPMTLTLHLELIQVTFCRPAPLTGLPDPVRAVPKGAVLTTVTWPRLAWPCQKFYHTTPALTTAIHILPRRRVSRCFRKTCYLQPAGRSESYGGAVHTFISHWFLPLHLCRLPGFAYDDSRGSSKTQCKPDMVDFAVTAVTSHFGCPLQSNYWSRLSGTRLLATTT